MGGSSGGTTQTESVPKWLEDQIRGLNTRAVDASFAAPQGGFEGDFFAPENQQQIQGLNTLNRTGNLVRNSGVGQDAFDLAQQTLRGDFLDPSTNAPLQQIIDQLSGTISDREESSRNLSNSGFTASGGSNIRQAFENAQISEDASRTEAETISNLLFGNQQFERGLQQNAPALLDAALATLDFPGSRELEVGTAFQGFDQRDLDNLIAQFMESTEGGFRPLNQLSNILNAGNVGGTVNLSGGGPSTASSVLTGGLGGAAAGAAAGSLFPGPGTLVGGLLGGLGGSIIPIV